MPITFTLDLEDHLGAYDPAGRWLRNTETLLDFCAAKNIHGTFFAVGRCAAAPELLRKITAAGHELALHSYDHIPLTAEEARSYGGKLAAAKKDFEDVTGKKIAGFRAPVFSLTPRSRWAVDVLRAEGFIYSSSVISGKSAFAGYPGAPYTPFRWGDRAEPQKNIPLLSGGDKGEGRTHELGQPAFEIRPPPAPPEGRGEEGLIEIPVPALHLGGAALPFLGGVYLRYLPLALVRRLQKIQPPETLLWTYLHPYDIDAEEGCVRLRDGTPLWANLLLMNNRKNFLAKLGALLHGNAAPPLIARVEALKNLPVFSA